MAWPLRIVVTVVTAFGVAVVTAIGLALIDMYLAGHDRPSWVGRSAGLPGDYTSWGDLALLATIAVAGIAAWILSGSRR